MGWLHRMLQLQEEEEDLPADTATRTTTTTRPSILVLVEASTTSNNTSTQDLSRWFHQAWLHRLPNHNSANTACHFACRGRGLGGTTNINAGWCITADFTSFWPAPWNHSLPPATRAIQQYLADHGSLQPSSSHTSVDDDDDHPWKVPQLLVDDHANHHRWNYYQAFRIAERTNQNHHHNITIITHAHVDRIVVVEDDPSHRRNKTTTTVQGRYYNNNNEPLPDTSVAQEDLCSSFQFRAQKEVILCAGAFASPQLLLRSSSIFFNTTRGNRRIPFLLGKHLHDQVILARPVFCFPATNHFSRNGVVQYTQFHLQDDTNQQYHHHFQVLLLDSTVYRDVLPHVLSSPWFVHPTTAGILQPFLRLFWTILLFYTPIYFVLRYCTYTLALCYMNPQSSSKGGYVTEQEIVLPTFNSTQDRKALRDAYWHSATLVPSSSHSFWDPLASRNSFVPFFLQRLFLEFSIRHLTLPYFHWTGTCRMETETQDGVVDSHLKLKSHGDANLNIRVCDASVFPHPLSVPPALTCAGLGYVLANLMTREERKNSTTVQGDDDCTSSSKKIN